MLLSAFASTGSTAATVVNVKAILYSAWFCPYAQRVWAALNQWQLFPPDDGSLEVVEALQLEQGHDTTASASYGYHKNTDLLRYNPKGLVPTLVVIQELINKEGRRGNKDAVPETSTQERVYCESLDILKELHLLKIMKRASNNGETGDDERRAVAEIEEAYQHAVDWNKRICSTFYKVLMQCDKDKREQAWVEMTMHLTAFSQHLADKSDNDGTAANENHGEFYQIVPESKTGAQPGIVDFAVFPFVHRLCILEHYRGFSLPVSTLQEQQAKARLMAWQEAMESLPGVKSTLADRAKLIAIYKRYADATAQSQVAQAVIQGKEAHTV